ncbi:MAG: TRAM domain-containing protein [Candidatus Omnitrophica bacterium]|nr:TRAM domain-containing protein [Candidatus Omnitrophota bacterium]
MTIGILIGALVILLDMFFKKATVKNMLSILLGIILGLLLNKLFIDVISLSNLDDDVVAKLNFISALVFSYLGAVLILRGQEEFQLMIPFVRLDTKASGNGIVLLDTSVIIDGRIADMCETDFIGGQVIVPGFVLKELQAIADSSDGLKRNRGRRGLDVLNKIKNSQHVSVKVHELDFPEIHAVDAKLVKMAQELNARIFTNDFNLNKVAELQGIKVLNINALANALKPVVMPGEMMTVKILKEGKEDNQGVAYLDDGTMVVVDNGRKAIGHTVNVSITSVLQTQAGRMIFAKAADEEIR